MSTMVRAERVQVVVIGAGQAGLSVGYHLAQRGIQFVILEAKERIGDSWRERWDSLRLFTPGSLDGLDGMPFPTPGHRFPTKDEMADYLEAYASRFRLPVRTGVRVTGLTRRGDRYLVSAGDLRFEADHVVVAMATYQEPRIPAFAGELAPEIRQLHSREYRRPSQLQPGGVLVVGAGNSGAEIALEAVRNGHPTWLSGRDTGKIPFRIDSLLSRFVLQPLLLRVIFHRLLTVDTPMGRKVRPKVMTSGAPLIRTRPKELDAAGVRRVARTAGTHDGWPRLEDGTRARRGERRLVHRVPSGVLLDRSPGPRRARRAEARARAGAAGAGHFVRRAALPLRDVVHDDPRGGTGCGADRGGGRGSAQGPGLTAAVGAGRGGLIEQGSRPHLTSVSLDVRDASRARCDAGAG